MLILFHCAKAKADGPGFEHWVGMARNREDAKRQAKMSLGGNADHYVVSPLSNPNERVVFAL